MLYWLVKGSRPPYMLNYHEREKESSALVAGSSCGACPFRLHVSPGEILTKKTNF